MSIRIREAAPEELGLVYRMMREAFEEYRGKLNPPSGALSETLEDIARNWPAQANVCDPGRRQVVDPRQCGILPRMDYQVIEEQAYPGDTDRWYIKSKRLIADTGAVTVRTGLEEPK